LREEAELFSIYDAKINNITNFGAFAEVIFAAVIKFLIN
jgi:predicted RNA-binding protein with RPS1 domain